MSATLNAERFSEYLGGCPTTHIPGFTHPVRDLFLEEVLAEVQYDIPAGGDGGSGGYGGGGGGGGGGGRGRMDRAERAKRRERQANMNAGTEFANISPIDPIEEEDVCAGGAYAACSARVKQSLLNWDPDKIDLGLLVGVLEHICLQREAGAILVFLTGWDDISKLLDEAKRSRVLSDSCAVRLLPLHGSMPTVNQREIFDRPPPGMRKIVVATNIAETSITIDDIAFVVDTGKAKEKTYDPVNKLACLLPAWISRASARQRRGRAGRVQAGVCYHLYPSGAHAQMEEYQLPEILRTPLEELCLQIKLLRLGMIAPFMEKAMDAPKPLAVHNAIQLLVQIGALSNNSEETLTSLGQHLAALPVDPRVGKMLIYASVMQCLPAALTIAAGMAYKDPWVMPLDKKQAADEAR
jgi:ATP-dependent RNA helicase DHX36